MLLLVFRIKEHELLGEGAFGQVYKATVYGFAHAKKQTVAIKKLKGSKQHFLIFNDQLHLCQLK